jgi:hypothetical protein
LGVIAPAVADRDGFSGAVHDVPPASQPWRRIRVGLLVHVAPPSHGPTESRVRVVANCRRRRGTAPWERRNPRRPAPFAGAVPHRHFDTGAPIVIRRCKMAVPSL